MMCKPSAQNRAWYENRVVAFSFRSQSNPARRKIDFRREKKIIAPYWSSQVRKYNNPFIARVTLYLDRLRLP